MWPSKKGQKIPEQFFMRNEMHLKILGIFHCNTEPFLLCSVIESGKMQMKIVETILFEKWLVGENH